MKHCLNKLISRGGIVILWGLIVAFIILSPSAIEASHPRLMRQFELFAIITQPIALMSIAACQVSGRLCLFT